MKYQKVLLLIMSYLIGTISPAYLLAKYKYGFDIRTRGSNNPGTSNAFRTMGKTDGIITFFVDMIKGFIPAMAGNILFGQRWGAILGLVTVIGHNFPFYFNFKGGKGVATSLGAVGAIFPITTLIIFVIGLVLVAISKIVSISSITCFTLFVILSIYNLMTGGDKVVYSIYIILGIMGLITHRSNIKRLIEGNENKI